MGNKLVVNKFVSKFSEKKRVKTLSYESVRSKN